MGCSASVATVKDISLKNEKGKNEVGGISRSSSFSDDEGLDSGIESQHCSAKQRPSQLAPLPPIGQIDRKPVAFEIAFNNNDNINSILNKTPPKRFQLAPLPALSLQPEDIEAKLKAAEKKRAEELLKRCQSANRSTRRRKKITERRQSILTEQAQQLQREQTHHDENREKVLADRIDKQHRREERARRAREKLLRIQTVDSETLDMEKDDAFNDDVNDTWDDDKPIAAATRSGERHHSMMDPRVGSATPLHPTVSTTSSDFDIYDVQPPPQDGVRALPPISDNSRPPRVTPVHKTISVQSADSAFDNSFIRSIHKTTSLQSTEIDFGDNASRTGSCSNLLDEYNRPKTPSPNHISNGSRLS